MFNSLEMASLSQYGFGDEDQMVMRRKLSIRFLRILNQGKLRMVVRGLLGREWKLRDLSQLGHLVRRSASCDVVYVPLRKIVGSEGRVGDFDNAFNPLNSRMQDRWINVAVARAQGHALPPVELIRAGDSYYVRDGHHRISVAHAAGQVDIEARIVHELA